MEADWFEFPTGIEPFSMFSFKKRERAARTSKVDKAGLSNGVQFPHYQTEQGD